MADVSRLVRGARNRAARLLAYDKSPYSRASTYYPQQPSCQIPALAFLFARFLGERSSGTFVEIGANDGTFCSNTWGLAQRGWRGILVEPVPELAERCRNAYRHLPGITVVNCAIAAPGTNHVDLHLAGTLTTANEAALAEYQSVPWASRFVTADSLRIEARTLNELLASQQIEPGFDLLVVDVEGFEAEVFAGFSIEEWRPGMLIIELADTHPDLTVTAGSDGSLLETLSDLKYRIVFKDMVNTVFMRQDLYQAGLASLISH